MTRTSEKRGELVGGAANAEAVASSRSVTMPGRGGVAKGLQQIFTPEVVARFIASVVGAEPWQKFAVLDLTAGAGHLLAPYPENRRLGVEIDGDQEYVATMEGRAYRSIVGDVQRVFPMLRSLLKATGAWLPVVVANPPFSLDWEVPGVGKGSSTYVTMRMVRKLLSEDGMGVLITGRERFEKECKEELQEKLFALVEVEQLFKGVDLPCVIAFWRESKPTMKGIKPYVLKLKHYRELEGQERRLHPWGSTSTLGDDIHRVHIQRFGSWFPVGRGPSDEELNALRVEYELRRAARLGDVDAKSPYLVRMRGAKMAVRLSAFATLALSKQGHGVIRWVESFHGQPPTYFALQSKEWRRLLKLAEDSGLEVDPLVVRAVEDTLVGFRKAATPMYPLSGVQLLGFLDDVDSIVCKKGDAARGYEEGKRYDVNCATKVLCKVEEREDTNADGEPVVKEVEVARKAMDISIGRHHFVESAEDLAYILEHFEVPDPGDVGLAEPHKLAFWRRVIDRVEVEIQANLKGFRFRWFQKDDLARGLVKRCFVLAWEQGLGKALGIAAYVRALELGGCLPDGCALFPMPQDLAKQFAAEVKRFFNRDVLMVGTLGRFIGKQHVARGPGGFASAMRRMDSGTWAPDEVTAGAPRVGEVTAFEARGMVLERRRWLRARNEARHKHLPFNQPEPPGVWVVTWYEALAVTGRIDEALPLRDVGMHLVAVRADTAEDVPKQLVGEVAMRDMERALGKQEARARVKQEFSRFWSGEFCPSCRADRDSGWDGRVCRAPLAPRPDEKGHSKDDAAHAERRRVSGWASPRRLPTGRVLPSELNEGATSHAEYKLVGRKVCGYVDVKLRRKPAYSVLRNVFRAVCVDEGTKIKGDNSLASKAIRAIRARWKVVASGTPQKNFVTDLFWLLYWALGDSSPRFPYAYQGGRWRFTDDFAVVETELVPDKENKGQKRRGRVKVLPEVSNLLRLWKLLCPSLARRRMDEVGCVVDYSGKWLCKACEATNTAEVKGPGGRWQKPAALECAGCAKVWDAIVPLTYRVVKVPWGVAQKKMHLDWLNEDNFVKHFARKHPNSPAWKMGPGMVRRMAACLGQLAKLDYACTDPASEPDGDYTPQGISPWTPMRTRMLQDIEAAVRRGGKCLVGSCLVGVGPWVAEKLGERGIRATHITDAGADGKARTLSPKERAGTLLAFREGKYDVLCVGVQAVSLGHNLDIATDVFCDGFPWDFATWDQYLKRARRLSSMRPVTVWGYFPEGSLGQKKWDGLKDKTDSSDLVLDGRITARREVEVNKASVLREMQEAGARFDGTEVPEAQAMVLWLQGPSQAPSFSPPRRRQVAPVAAPATSPAPPALPPPAPQGGRRRVQVAPQAPEAPAPLLGGRRRVQVVQPAQGTLLPELAPRFRTFLLNPPWEEYGGMVRAAQGQCELLPYQQMPRVIRGSGLFLPFEDAHLYCWVSNAFLREGLWLVEQLGFRYVTKLTWVKTTGAQQLEELHQEDSRTGIGQYFRGEDEVLLFATRGQGMHASVYSERKDLGTAIVAPHPRGRDGRILLTAKPLEAYARIMARSKGPYLEVFGRGAPPFSEWTVWGQESLRKPVQLEQQTSAA